MMVKWRDTMDTTGRERDWLGSLPLAWRCLVVDRRKFAFNFPFSSCQSVLLLFQWISLLILSVAKSLSANDDSDIMNWTKHKVEGFLDPQTRWILKWFQTFSAFSLKRYERTGRPTVELDRAVFKDVLAQRENVARPQQGFLPVCSSIFWLVHW